MFAEKRYFLLCLLICLQVTSSFAQEDKRKDDRIMMRGIVMDASSLTPLPYSQITVNGNFTVIGNRDGSFAFYVIRNDSVLIENLGYKPARLHISDTITGSELITGVYMNSDTISIGEVVIVPGSASVEYDLLRAEKTTPVAIQNARYNVAISAYQGRYSQAVLGDPAINYEILRQQQKIDAYEKGGVPSDRMVGLSPLMLIPAAYMLINGLPEKPDPYKPQLTEQEMEMIHNRYIEVLHQKRGQVTP